MDAVDEQGSSTAEMISAYYSLVFPTVTFYVRTLSVTIGRRCSTNTNAATSSPDAFQVDVDLGALKSVSRLHAKIEYDQEEDRFVLIVVGRNGAWVDGVWSGSGTRAPLGERSQIQIASRTFHFVLPPPPPPEDTPSPSSQASTRPRSPSLDITSISPPSTPQSHSPPPIDTKPPPPLPEPQIHTPKPSANKTNPKKRKKTQLPSPPKPKPVPADIPEKPPLTLRQLIQLAIKDLDGKATLQEICTWIMNGYEHYQHADDKWMSSVRHTLSSDKHFKKMERCGGTRGKGFFWSIEDDADEQFTPTDTGASTSGKAGKGSKKKERRSEAKKTVIQGDSQPVTSPPPTNGTAAVAPASATPTLVAAPANVSAPVTTGVFAYSSLSSSSYPTQNPYAPLTQGHWGIPAPASTTSSTTPSAPPPTASSATPPVSGPDVSIPIILGPIPPTHPDYSPTHPNNSAKEGYMILHERTLVLDPDVFSGVSTEMLKELEKMGARKAFEYLARHKLRTDKERRAARARGRGRGRGRGQPPGRAASSPHDTSMPAAETTLSAGGKSDKVPTNVDVKPPVPVPISAVSNSGGGRADSPLIVVDDSDEDDKPVAKRRKVDEETSVGTT